MLSFTDAVQVSLSIHAIKFRRYAAPLEATGLAASLTLPWPFLEIDATLKEFFPAGINARGNGVGRGPLLGCFDSSHKHNRGSWISG